jgi:hypothetical protein
VLSAFSSTSKIQEALSETKFTVIAVTGLMKTLRAERKEQEMFENFDRAKATT